LPNGILKIAGLPLEEDLYQSDLRIEDEQLAALLKEGLKPKKKKGAKKEGDAPATETPKEAPKVEKKEVKKEEKKSATDKKSAKSPKKP
jgi:hypothetical protein